MFGETAKGLELEAEDIVEFVLDKHLNVILCTVLGHITDIDQAGKRIPKRQESFKSGRFLREDPQKV
jgi:hypothetical protein